MCCRYENVGINLSSFNINMMLYTRLKYIIGHNKHFSNFCLNIFSNNHDYSLQIPNFLFLNVPVTYVITHQLLSCASHNMHESFREWRVRLADLSLVTK
jgi:hypothetical protein